MVYLLYGTNDYLIEEYVKKISKNIDKMNTSTYDLENNILKTVIDDAETFSLFQDKKLIICDNANIFTAGASKDMDLIQKYLSNINPATVLVFIVHTDKIDGRKKITTLVKSIGKVKEFNEETNALNIIKEGLKGYNINYNDMMLFASRVGDNPLIVKNEISKVKLYKEEGSSITRDDIINLTTKNIDTDIFKFIDSIVKKRREEAIEFYHNMLMMNEEPIKIIVMLADQFRIIYQSKELMMMGYSEKSIAETLKIHPYRVKLAIQNGRSYSSDVLLKLLGDLADLDIGIKSGQMNKDLALELFLLKL